MWSMADYPHQGVEERRALHTDGPRACRLTEYQCAREKLVLQWRERIGASYQPRREVQDHSSWLTIARDHALERETQQVETRGGRAIGGGKAEAAQNRVCVAGVTRRGQHLEASDRLVRECLKESGSAKLRRQHAAEGHRGHNSRGNLLCLQISDIARKNELALQR